MPKLLCVEPSATQQAIIRGIAGRHQLEVIVCKGEAEALSLLDQQFCVMLVANELQDGDSFQLIESVRLSLEHATLPIAFISGSVDRALAYNAMNAGATEVFMRDDLSALDEFIAGCAGAPLESFESGGTVLLVEDSESHAEYVAHLCAMLGLHVEKCKDVQTALNLYRPRKYQLAIVDVVLNDIQSGITLVRRIRQNHQSRQPILVMSGYDDLPRRLLALKSGADDFISKPFSPEEFVWRVKKVLRSYAGHDRRETALPLVSEAMGHDFMHALSPREREIAAQILAGSSDKQIARDLGISYWTVRSHIEQIFTKTGALNRRDLMARFIGK
ncbi:response regulator [Dechloromonas sp. HYN0024]|uniref:response regulator n=1 Tax=Dechloromonas sp. HYN0024 TaxID=2231055 RepID=UPI0013C2B5BE|nr:response regulator [Dechloromonas sp. HYN0024]